MRSKQTGQFTNWLDQLNLRRDLSFFHMSLLILPGDPGFEEVLGSHLPPGWQQFACKNSEFCFVADSDTGLLRPATTNETTEYLEGGEYDERLSYLEEIDADWIEINQGV